MVFADLGLLTTSVDAASAGAGTQELAIDGTGAVLDTGAHQ